MQYEDLSQEQKLFIDLALRGENILVDACIGSGKTTAIQTLCGCYGPEKHILYLTYNKLLKLDAKAKIKTRGTMTNVTNYHGFAYSELIRNGVKPSFNDCIQTYNRVNPPIRQYDVLILDEYQDIELEIAEMLWRIKAANPQMQIIAVGDMAQKIYDKTRLDVPAFISSYLDTYKSIEFTQCFRLSQELAGRLGRIWGKQINGVNQDCVVETLWFRDALEELAKYEPSQILCLGANTGKRNALLNSLEQDYPEKFNKNTVWSRVSEMEGGTAPDEKSAVFTTFDGCKGMERDVCVVCDWTEDYWDMRISRAQVKAEIIRNVFCVAASRGKRRIIFLRDNNYLRDLTLCDAAGEEKRFEDVVMSGMFNFKYVEDVEDAYQQLDVKEVHPKDDIINVPTKDGMIDLSFCIGVYQEVAYFTNCSIDKYIQAYFTAHKDKDFRLREMRDSWSLEEKVLFYASLETEQNRYMNQVQLPLVPEDAWNHIADRLATVLPANADVQVECRLPFGMKKREAFLATGLADAVMDNTVYELKFVDELAHVHFLQCASYMVSMGLKKGILWNVKSNQRYEIRIPNEKTFLDKVSNAITKGMLPIYGMPLPNSAEALGISMRDAFDYKATFAAFVADHPDACEKVLKKTEYAAKANVPFGAVAIERAFANLGVTIPMVAKTFRRYWKDYCEEQKKQRRAKKKKK